MPDICMCTGQGCPFKETCYRACAKPGMLQSFFSLSPLKWKLGVVPSCDYFWTMEAL